MRENRQIKMQRCTETGRKIDITIWERRSTVCPGSSYPNSYNELLINWGNYLLDTRYKEGQRTILK